MIYLDEEGNVSKAAITIAIRLRYDYDKTTIRRYHDAFDYDESDRSYNSTAIRLLPLDAIRREQKMNMSIFRRSRVVVVS